VEHAGARGKYGKETQTNETTIETDMVAVPQTFLFFGRDDRRGAAAT
jgi:hypothetical protein